MLTFYSRSFRCDITMACWLLLKHSWFLINIIPTHPVVHFVCQGYTPSGKSRFFNYSGRNGEDSLKDLCLACFESGCPVAWHNQRSKLISGSAVCVKGDAICFQARFRIRWSSILQVFFITVISPAHILLESVRFTSCCRFADSTQFTRHFPRRSYCIFILIDCFCMYLLLLLFVHI